jgi:hypothetical protein
VVVLCLKKCMSRARHVTEFCTLFIGGEDIECMYCNLTSLVCLFIRFSGISYGRFIAILHKFELPTYIQGTVSDR